MHLKSFLPGLCAVAALALASPALAQHDHQGHAAPAPAAAASVDPALAAVLADSRRDADRARDAWRHPGETLAFFQVRPGMTVVDYMPSSGWWTRVLAPYLGDNGRYIGLNPDVTNASDRQRQMFGNAAETFPARAAAWTGMPAERVPAYNTNTLPAELNGTVDRVMVMREMHNLFRFGWLHRELTAIRALLKDDGMLGIEQHRARADAPFAYVDGSKGYMRERDVIALVEAHGFELVARGEVNANPVDPANHPAGAWTLPPNLSQGEADRARYVAIGETDRMTLLFRKRP